MKPADIFDRDREWAELERHVTSGRALLGIVTGRRRVGKTFLLRRLAREHKGLLISCLQEERAPALRRFADELGGYHGIALGAPADWAAAIAQATTGPLAVPLLIIDEFPYLVEHSPELESVLQHAVDRGRDDAGTRIILAGSSLAVMGGLLDGNRPLRGRADLQLRLEPFDYRTSASFWGISDPALAFRVHAIVGGSPGYRPLLPNDPTSAATFDTWVTKSVLNPASALYHEDSYLLAEDRRLNDRTVYSSILRAVAEGDHRPSRIGGRLGRPQTSLSHALGVLGSAGFLHNDTGLLSGRDPLYRIADEIIGFIRSCVDPWRPLIDEGRSSDAWALAAPRWSAGVLGPHLELLARTWARRFAAAETLGGPPGLVGRADVPDAAGRVTRELDLVVLRPGSRPGTDAQVQAIGEVKLQADVDAAAHLDRCVELLQQRGHGRPDRMLIIAESFSPAVVELARRRADLSLVSLADLYGQTAIPRSP